ncbi:SAF domain protein [Pseudarthrobacter chlorophenolicus A6]|uniref:SAF domain protein n=1 Tax=Pseudarthrobacter chlorophenolicus (strain ATCC 700700 / DSM 12829 / CIP 107037 / JCM 12360 / KCTC 9906 / NCIMB 13794 / A6) TaxID=452863 RepID=B8HCJ5_PSECP|nr:Flp pilus assembly protein CpaB [Pseudarthrobacter chlorophenolicus]ACL40611.1 SAF domain protein [Pseudarthrobacter chlorophenolicus A6]SDQ78354.1 pilus assembly protein CpaB [Pseudarthrobacter chlorophenolicus]
MKSRLLAGTAAVALALVGALLIIVYANGADARAMASTNPKKVLVVEKPIPAGTPINDMTASLVIEDVPATAIAPTALTSLDSKAGTVAAVDLVPGEQLLAERLVAPEALKAEGGVQIPPGLQEVTFELEPKRVVGGRIQAGDHVGIGFSFAGGADKAKPADASTQLTLRKVTVTAIQRAPQAASAEAPADGSNPQDTTLPQGSLMVTVAVNDIDATKIIYASNNGDLWLTKEPLDAQDNGGFIARKDTVYK